MTYQATQQVPKEEQNYSCFQCKEPIYFKRGFFAENGKPQRFNVSNDEVHVCDNEARDKHNSDRRRKAYFAQKDEKERAARGEPRRESKSKKHKETRRERENRKYNEAQDRARQQQQEDYERKRTEERRKQEQREEDYKSRSRYEDFFNIGSMTYQKAILILKLAEGFTKQDLENQKRTLWLKYHPDRNHGVDASKLFRDVTDAYEYLVKFL